MFNCLTAELDNTILRLNSISRKLTLLKEGVINNKDYLNPFDIDVYRKIVSELNEDINTLNLIDQSINTLVKGCDEILNEMEKDMQANTSCYLISTDNIDLTHDLKRRLKFQLKGLIAVRGIKTYYINHSTLFGELVREVLEEINSSLNILEYEEQETKFSITWNTCIDILEFREL